MPIYDAIERIEDLIKIEENAYVGDGEENWDIDALEAALALLKERREKYKNKIKSDFYYKFPDLIYDYCSDLSIEEPILCGDVVNRLLIEGNDEFAEEIEKLSEIVAETLSQNIDAKPKSYYDKILEAQEEKENEC